MVFRQNGSDVQEAGHGSGLGWLMVFGPLGIFIGTLPFLDKKTKKRFKLDFF